MHIQQLIKVCGFDNHAAHGKRGCHAIKIARLGQKNVGICRF
jgi:hypothetical protein